MATSTERLLAEMWRSVLGMDRVGVNDHYADLGGDSLMAVMIFGLIRETFGRPMSMKVFVESPTIAILSAQLDALDAQPTDERKEG